jgi:hypothetical protein
MKRRVPHPCRVFRDRACPVPVERGGDFEFPTSYEHPNFSSGVGLSLWTRHVNQRIRNEIILLLKYSS